MKTLWRKKRLLMITLLFLMGVAGVFGGLALAATFKAESLLSVASWVVFGGPALVGLALIAPGACGGFRRTKFRSDDQYMNLITGEPTDNPIDAEGYGVGS